MEKGEYLATKKVVINLIVKMGVTDQQAIEIADVSIDLVKKPGRE